jgi:hypothetical protein
VWHLNLARMVVDVWHGAQALWHGAEARSYRAGDVIARPSPISGSTWSRSSRESTSHKRVPGADRDSVGAIQRRLRPCSMAARTSGLPSLAYRSSSCVVRTKANAEGARSGSNQPDQGSNLPDR